MFENKYRSATSISINMKLQPKSSVLNNSINVICKTQTFLIDIKSLSGIIGKFELLRQIFTTTKDQL